MKKLFFVTAVCLSLTGCYVQPVGPAYVSPEPVYVAPAPVYVGPAYPTVIVGPGRCCYGGHRWR